MKTTCTLLAIVLLSVGIGSAQDLVPDVSRNEYRQSIDAAMAGALQLLLWIGGAISAIIIMVFPWVVMSRLKKIEALLERISRSLDRAEDRGTGDNPFQK